MKGAVSVKLLSAWRKTVKMTVSNVLLSALPEQMEEHTLVRCRIGLLRKFAGRPAIEI